MSFNSKLASFASKLASAYNGKYLTVDSNGDVAPVDLVIPQGIPSGAVAYFAMTTPPTGWIKANGAILDRTTYAALFSAIGTLYNTGGETGSQFRCADLRGEFIRGWSDGHTVDSGRALGSNQADDNKSHTHSHSMPGIISANGGPYGIYTSANIYAVDSVALVISGSGGPEARPRNVALLACIKI
jgi:microcystin-dependent protein